MPVVQPSGVPYFGSLLLLSLIIVCSAFKQNRLNQKLSKLSVVLVGAEFVHFAHCADQLTQNETTTLETIKYQHAQKGVAQSHQKYCVPRQ
jgi:hypothetical protein